MSYDHWKTTNPYDEWLGPEQEEEEQEEQEEQEEPEEEILEPVSKMKHASGRAERH